MSILIDQFRQPRNAGDAIDLKIRSIAWQVDTVLLLGGDDGTGYAKSLMQIALRRHQPTFAEQEFRAFIIEHSREKYAKLRNNVGNGLIQTYNVYPVDAVMTELQVRQYYANNSTRDNLLSIQDALDCRSEENQIYGILENNYISTIKFENDITEFGLVICDGTWFSAASKIDETTEDSEWYLLHDIDTIKNGQLFNLLTAKAPDYVRVPIGPTTADDDKLNVALFHKV